MAEVVGARGQGGNESEPRQGVSQGAMGAVVVDDGIRISFIVKALAHVPADVNS